MIIFVILCENFQNSANLSLTLTCNPKTNLNCNPNSKNNHKLVMARYIVSYRISQYWGHIVAYRYHGNYPKNEIDIAHNSN